jgi:hypothetical protein
MNRCVHVVVQLGVADLLAEGPQPVADLAESTGAHRPSLYRILRALASEGVFSEVEPGRFALTPVGELLRADHPNSMRDAFADGPHLWAPWGEIAHTARTGQPAFEKVHGKPWFDWLASDIEANAWFNRSMLARARLFSRAIVSAYDFTGLGSVVDVGGGTGLLLSAILEANPLMSGVLLDLPNVVEQAPPVLHQAGVTDRCRVVSGDFFESVPADADGYVLSSILHDWDDERAVHILEVLRRAIPAHGRLLIVESVIPPGDEAHPGKWFDITMLVVTGGRERTADEFGAILESGGFALSRVVPTQSPVSVVEAVPA